MNNSPLPKFSFFERIKLLTMGIFRWKIPTHLTTQELLTLKELANSIKKDGVAVEIGSYLGASSLILAKSLPSRTKLFCIDTWANHAMTEGEWNTYEIFLRNTKTVTTRVTPIRSYSVDAAKNFSKKIDLLFLDGDHSYEGVKSDVDTWLPKLNDGALIIMHDIGWAKGVQRVVEEDIKPRALKDGRLPNMYWAWIQS